MFTWRIAAAAGAAALSVGAAEAAYIVDTGPVQPTSFNLALIDVGGSYQHLGATFNVAEESSITSVEGWIGGVGNLVFELHMGLTPGGPLLFSSPVSVSDSAYDWRGATGLDWTVPAGDYSLAVIAQPGFSGRMPVYPPNPLGTNWFTNSLFPNWTTAADPMGWRVDAIATSVPEPASAVLYALGLAVLGFGVRRRLQR